MSQLPAISMVVLVPSMGLPLDLKSMVDGSQETADHARLHYLAARVLWEFDTDQSVGPNASDIRERLGDSDAEGARNPMGATSRFEPRPMHRSQ